MSAPTLFGEISVSLGSHPENLASESLRYLLDRYQEAWPDLRAFLGLSGAVLPVEASFQTQAALKGEGIPDLVVSGPDGNVGLIVEAKFWAGLTENQPVSYFEGLSEQGAGMLLFIVT